MSDRYKVNLGNGDSRHMGSSHIIENYSSNGNYDEVRLYLQDAARLAMYWHLKRQQRAIAKKDEEYDNNGKNNE